MCDFASFLITNTGEIKVYDMLSHSNTTEHFKLKPETYREVEWIANNPEFLTVRYLDTDSIVFKKARESILSMYPTRKDFLNKYFTEEVQLNMVKQTSFAIQYIDNPSKAVQLAAVKQDCYTIEYIKNPTQKVKLVAVKQHGCAIRHIKNPSEKIQLAAIQEDFSAVQFIDNLSEEMQLAAVKKSVIALRFIKNPTQKVVDFCEVKP